MKKIFPLLVFFGLIGTTTFAQNKRAENFSAVKNYFIVKSSNGPFLELTPTKEGLRKDKDIPNKTCYGVYVQTDDHSGAVSAVVTLMKDKELEFSEPLIRYFRQDSKKEHGQRGYLIIYKKKKGDIPKDASVIEFN